MSAKTDISWADATWPLTVGCKKVSAGCSNCYAMRDARRMGSNPNPKISEVYNGLVVQQKNGLLNWTGAVRELPERLDWPARWREHRDIFVCSQSDLLHEDISDEFIGRAFRAMRDYSWHTYYVLTKRPERLVELLSETPPEGLEDFNSTNFPNVIVGISAEDQKAADTRMPLLVQVPLDATQRFVSAEPLIGPLDLSQWLHDIGWVIAGGESGKYAKIMHPPWPRLLRDQCNEADVAFHFKQWGEWTPTLPLTDVAIISDQGTRYHIRTHNTRAISPRALIHEDITFYRLGRKKTGRILDGEYWNARPGEDTAPIFAPRPLGTPVVINANAGPEWDGTRGIISTIQSDEDEDQEVDGEEVTYYVTANGSEFAQAFGYWQLTPEDETQEHSI